MLTLRLIQHLVTRNGIIFVSAPFVLGVAAALGQATPLPDPLVVLCVVYFIPYGPVCVRGVESLLDKSRRSLLTNSEAGKARLLQLVLVSSVAFLLGTLLLPLNATLWLLGFWVLTVAGALALRVLHAHSFLYTFAATMRGTGAGVLGYTLAGGVVSVWLPVCAGALWLFGAHLFQATLNAPAPERMSSAYQQRVVRFLWAGGAVGLATVMLWPWFAAWLVPLTLLFLFAVGWAVVSFPAEWVRIAGWLPYVHIIAAVCVAILLLLR